VKLTARFAEISDKSLSL